MFGFHALGDDPDPYIAGKASGWLNGQVIGSAGYRVTLYNKPEALRELLAPTRWSLDDMAKGMESSFKQALKGGNFFTPAAPAS